MAIVSVSTYRLGVSRALRVRPQRLMFVQGILIGIDGTFYRRCWSFPARRTQGGDFVPDTRV